MALVEWRLRPPRADESFFTSVASTRGQLFLVPLPHHSNTEGMERNEGDLPKGYDYRY